ncbi:MAG: Gfo/Idh/MocA family oxidoreductase [Gemmatimonadota bacterium]|nr:Gfo/Idh/MocA family oxidoreductase [Gemmatimonadota bacterium]
MPETYRVAIVGCGGMGGSHARAWTSKDRIDLVAVADVSQESADRLGKEYGVNAYSDYRAMFGQEKPDIVSITTWQNVRAEITVAAAEAAVKGILGEKPMAASSGESSDMIEACQRHGVKLAIGHQRRYVPQNVEARRLVQSGAIGQPTVMLRRDGHGLLNRGTHEIDELMFMLGDPAPLWVMGQVGRKTDRWERRVRCEDTCSAIICFEGGVRGVYESDLPEPGLHERATIYGTEGQLKRGEEGTILLMNSAQAGWQTITPPEVQVDQFDDFVGWMDGTLENHRNNGYQAKIVMDIMMAIYESLRIRDVVEMPFTTRENPLDLLVEDGTLPVITPGQYDIRAPFPGQEEN